MELITDKGKIEIKNLTPHSIDVLNGRDEVVFTLSGSNNPPRVQENIYGQEEFLINGGQSLNIFIAHNDSVDKLPQKQEGVYYIVGRIIAEQFKERDDLLVPHEFVRNEDGDILGCRSFKLIAKG